MAVFANVLTCIAGFGFVNLSIAFAGAAIDEIVVWVAEKQKALGRIRSDGRVAGIIAATFFALCPILAEGVFWVAARADACVTLLTLAGVYVWASSPTSAMRAAALRSDSRNPPPYSRCK